MKAKIRFVINEYTSKHDVNGNRYHMAHVISTLTGKDTWVIEDTKQHALSALIQQLGKSARYESIFTINTDITKSEWKSLSKESKAVFLGNPGTPDLIDLEQEV